MNILLCNNRYFPSTGPERYIFSVTRLLEQHGHRVVPLAADYAQTLDTPYRKYFVPPPVDAASVYFREYASQLTIRKRIELTARATYYRNARAAAARAIEAEAIDLVYVLHTVNVLSPSVIDAGHAAGLPVVMSLADFSLLCPAYLFFRAGQVCQDCLGGYHHALRHRCLQGSLAVTSARVLAMTVHNGLGIYRKVDAFVAPSRYLAEQMQQFPAARGRVHQLSNFADPALLEGYDTQNTPATDGSLLPRPARPYFLYFGRIDPEKGIETLIRAYARLDRDVELVLAGASRDEFGAQMQSLAAALGATGVRFAGFVTGTPLAQLIAGSLGVVAPSLWHDNAPMTVYESLAQGKAVIGSNLGGIQDQLEGGCGLLIPPGDPTALATAMRQLVDDPALRRRLEEAASNRARTEYAPERHYVGLMAIIKAAQSVRSARRTPTRPATRD